MVQEDMRLALWKPASFGPSPATVETAAAEEGAAAVIDSGARVHTLLRAHYAEVWRVLRRLGVAQGSLEDAAQHVFMVLASKLADVEPDRERSFLVGTAVRVAANQRRSAAVRYERADDEMDARADLAPGADELLDEKRLRAVLDDVLDTLPAELRTVLVLFELEELGLTEIAEIIDVPRGTAASRLRRAREAFELAAKRVRARRSRAFEEET
jgi:RNA polymerase sigma-70 factor (ECF subfamily)